MKIVFGLVVQLCQHYNLKNTQPKNKKVASIKMMDSKKIFYSALMMFWFEIKNIFSKSTNKTYKYSRYHSQFGEDRYIAENINFPGKGVYVDVGAGHPTYLSNSYFFEKNDWKCICIDADINQIELLSKKRSNVEWAAISKTEGEIDFNQSFLPELSSTLQKEKYKGVLKIPFKNSMKVPAFNLETLLDKYHIDIIDILDIDVEGTELEVWESFNYEKHKPKVVIIEYYGLGLDNDSEKIKSFFENLPYQLVHTTCTNFIFLNRETALELFVTQEN